MNELVSVVLPLHKGANADFLRLALESVEEQNYHQIESIIVLDGPVGSNLINICENHVTNMLNIDRQAIIIQNINSPGPGGARNCGIKHSKGDYIAIQDSDDLSDSKRISTQFDELKSRGVDFVGSWLKVVGDDYRLHRVIKQPYLHDRIVATLPFRCSMNNPSVLGKKLPFLKLGYREDLKVSEDYDLWIRASLSGFKFANINYPLVFYRQNLADLGKRRGLEYAIADVKVKFRARKLVNLHTFPIFLFGLFMTFILRLLPTKLFRLVYLYRSFIS